jgi:arginine ABC superfamily ATP binding cassette transporter, binding protein
VIFQKYIAPLLLGGTILFAATGCGGTNGASEQGAKWRVGTDASYAPFGFQDEKTHEYVGYDIDIIRAVAAAQGHEVEIKNFNFDGLIPALQTGDLDIAISDMTINEGRAKSVDFTDSYYKAGLSIVVRVDETRYHTFDDLRGQKVGVTIGSTGAEVGATIPEVQLREYSTIADAFLDLQNGGVDAVVNDTPVDEYYVQGRGKGIAKVVPAQINEEDLGIAVKKGNAELLGQLNAGLRTIKENGTYAEIYRKWFGKEPPTK